MIFLIFVATFVTLACVVLPLAAVAVFAVLRSDAGQVPGDRSGAIFARGEEKAPPDRIGRETVVT